MKQVKEQERILRLLSKCQNDYENNLKDKKIMFIFEDKNKRIEEIETFFPINCLYHLTGIKVQRKDNQQILNSYSFYRSLQKGTLNTLQYDFIKKDSTTDLKLSVLPQLMRIDKMAKIIGDFSGYNLVLQTEKIAGNINACMGFVFNNKLNVYMPNTALNLDIRNITNNRKRIVAILKKDVTDNLYKNLVYLSKEYDVKSILKNEEINKNIDIQNIYSADLKIDRKIYEYMYLNEMEKNQLNSNDEISENIEDDFDDLDV